MERTSLLLRLTQPFVNLGPLDSMAEVATKLARARRSMREIREMEDLVARKAPNSEELSQAMKDIELLARSAADSASDAASILRSMIPGVSAYLSEVERAPD